MWQLTPGQRLEHRGWDDEYVIYNSLSGDTHLIGADAMGILLFLQKGAADAATMLAALPPSFTDAQRDRAAGLAVLLDQLHALSLVERT